MTEIDVGAVLAAKAPRIARLLPRWAVEWLRRTVREREINHILRSYSTLPPRDFIRACFREWGVTYSSEGLERLDPAGRYLFASNHPFGGMDGMMLADELIGRFGDARVVVNDLLMHLDPLRPLWLPVNKHGTQSAEYARRMADELAGPRPVLTFPAGLCSRRPHGRVEDPEWRPSFLKKAAASGRAVVPVFVEGCLSDRFYRLANLRRRLGLKFNVEMLWLPAEMFSQGGRHFRIRFGEPLTTGELAARGSLREQTEYVRHRAYSLQKLLDGTTPER